MTKPQTAQLTLVRARVEAVIDELRAGLSALRPPGRTGEPAILVASATAIIGVALVLVRGAALPAPDVRYIAAAPEVSLAAWKPATPAPTAAPKVTAEKEDAAFVPVFARSPLTRTEGIRVVLSTAHALIGRPYRYGASGPGAFDCSGFTSYVWRTAGIELPHNSRAQFGSLPQVSVDSLQPGDLVFSGSGGIGHVGLYVGGGRMINAPQTGRSVEIEPLRGNLIGAARPALLLKAKPEQS
ncbi:MAG: C40 family peptidase [Actinomycetota bacterium]